MFQEEFETVSKAATGKVALLKRNPLGYFVLAVLAGMYIGFGILLIFSIGSMLNGQPYAKIVMGVSFGIALSLVVIAGAELFTGNNLVIASGMMKKTITIGEGCKLWIVCYLGNLVGSLILAVLFHLSGLENGEVGVFIATVTLGKMTVPVVALFVRGILCNILVCLAVWCGFRCKSESGKLIMVFWCLFAFITTGFEHSVANMSIIGQVLIHGGAPGVSLPLYLKSLLFVSAGNIVGGVGFVALPYAVMAQKKN